MSDLVRVRHEGTATTMSRFLAERTPGVTLLEDEPTHGADGSVLPDVALDAPKPAAKKSTAKTAAKKTAAKKTAAARAASSTSTSTSGAAGDANPA